MLGYYTDPDTGLPLGRQAETIGTLAIKPGEKSVVAEVDRLIGLNEPIADFGIETMRRVWNRLIAEYPPGEGHNKCERLLATIITAANHAKSAGRLPEAVALSPKRWRKTLKTEWTRRTGVSVMHPDRPRYTETETRQLLSHINDAPPRLTLALDVTLGYRVQQVAGLARRSDIREAGQFGMQLRFLDAKKLKDVVIDPGPRQ